MIHINLLPEEYNRKKRTPLKLMLAVTGVVAVNASVAAWWGWTAFGVMAEVQSEYSVLQTEMDGLEPQVAYHRSLEAESGVYKHREDTLASITKKRVSWTRKVDELIDVVNRGGDGQRHLVWLDDLNVTQEGDRRSTGDGSVKASGHSGSDKFAQVANFLEDVEGSPFISDFHPPAPPEGSESIVDEDLMPAVVWAFPLQLALKSAEERQ